MHSNISYLNGLSLEGFSNERPQLTIYWNSRKAFLMHSNMGIIQMIEVCLLFTLIFVACGRNSGEFIALPTDVEIINHSTSLQDSNYNEGLRIAVYADSSGCTGCKLQLDMWQFYIEEIKESANDNVSFLFYLQPRDKSEILYLLEREEFLYPVYLDSKNLFGKMNGVHGDEVFLIDKKNKVLIKGNPLSSKKMRHAYEIAINEFLYGR